MNARNIGCALVKVLNHIFVSVISTSAEVILNLILTVLRYCTMTLLTLVASHNAVLS